MTALVDAGWYSSRLDDPGLLSKAVLVEVAAGYWALLVPCGGCRVAGEQSFSKPSLALRALEQIEHRADFPNVRLEDNQLMWGVPLSDFRSDDYLGRLERYGRAFGYSDTAIKLFLRRVEAIDLLTDAGVLEETATLKETNEALASNGYEDCC